VSGSAAGGAVWIQSAGALVLLAVAVHCGARLVQASRAAARPDVTDGADVLMALGLAAMLSPLGDPIPPTAGVVVFGVVAAWSLVGAVGAGEPGRLVAWVWHAVGGAAMVLMFAMPVGAAWTVLTWTLAAGFAWSALAAARGVVAVTTSARTVPAVVLAPPVTSLCHAVMAAGMVFLLLATASGG
jgi:hypothetical protein